MYTVGVKRNFVLDNQHFEWDAVKAYSNEAKHGVGFEEACEALLDPFAVTVDATDGGAEPRVAAIGFSHRLLFVVHVERAGDVVRIISARKADKMERAIYEN